MPAPVSVEVFDVRRAFRPGVVHLLRVKRLPLVQVRVR